MSTPEVCLIKDILPDNLATLGTLQYKNLGETALRFERADSAFLGNVWRAEQGSIEESNAAATAADAYLSRIAYKVTTAPTPSQHDLWAQRFTQASMAIFGQPDPDEARRLMHRQQQILYRYQSIPEVDQRAVDSLLEFYSSVAGEPPDKELPKIEHPLWPVITKFMNGRFGPVLDIIDKTCSAKEMITPAKRKEITIAMLEWLSHNHNSAWARWRVTEKNDATFSVYQETEEIVIGMLAAPIPPARVKNILIHEVLIHALRSTNGGAFNKYLALGLPGATEFDEGLATLFGWAVPNDANSGPRNLYTNTALALGIIDGSPVSRSKLLRVGYEKSKVIWQSQNGAGLLPMKQRRDNFIHTSRIFKGGRGDNFGRIQAVFTKDIIYHQGYKRAEQYIQAQLDAGKSMSEIFDYLMLGGFDPWNQQHVEYVRQVTGKEL